MNRTRLHLAAAAFLLALSGTLAAGCKTLAPPIKWNVGRIAWHSYEEGLARAKTEQKPICLVMYADWCEPCQRFSHVFADPRVVARAGDFVMVRVNSDEREDLDRKYGAGGRSLPRTYFLRSDGVLMKGAHAPRLCSKYDYDHKDPASLLAGMDLALQLAADPSADHGAEATKVTPEQVAKGCAVASGDDGCVACLKTSCCAEVVACIEDAASCMCATPPRGAAYAAELTCMKQHCPQCPIPK